MRLILARHGNTFGPGDRVVWVGGRDDLPLVAEGERQAMRLGHALRNAGVVPAVILCGPLQRTRRSAEIVIEILDFGSALIIEERLREIHYGAWSGLSNGEIIAAFGAQELDRWQKENRWPVSAAWEPGDASMMRDIKLLAADLLKNYRDQTVLCITSNGVLRYFFRLCESSPRVHPTRGAKVNTGHVCEIGHQDGHFQVVSWNLPPAEALYPKPAL